MSFTAMIEKSSPLLRRFAYGVDPNTQTIPEVIKQNLSWFEGKLISEEDCIKNCVKSIEVNLQPANCDLSPASQVELVGYISDFIKAVRGNPYFKSPNLFIGAFRQSLCEVVEKKWTDHMARSFIPITLALDKETQRDAAQKWTQKYFDGVAWLNKWEECQKSDSPTLISRLQEMTELTFLKMIETKTKEVQFEGEDSSGKNLKDSNLDLETYHLLEFENQPTIDEQRRLITECVSLGNKLKQNGQPIASPESAESFHTLFASILNK